MSQPAHSPTTPASQTLTVTTDRGTLSAALASVAPVITRSPARPVMEGVLLTSDAGDLLLTGYDHQTAITFRLPGAAHGIGPTVVDHAETTKLLSALTPAGRKRATDQTTVSITTGLDGPVLDVAGYTVPVTDWPATDYPTPLAPVPPVAHVERDTFTTDLTRVLTAAGTDDVLPQVFGVQLAIGDGAVRLASTDRYRLATVEVPALSTTGESTDRPQVIINTPLLRKLIKLIAKLPDAPRLRIGTGHDDHGWPVATLSCGPLTVTTQSTSQDYLDHHKLIANLVTPTGTVTTDRAALLAQTGLAAAVQAAKNTDRPVLLAIGANTVSIAPELPDGRTVTAPTLPADVASVRENTVFRFNPRYLTDALGCFTSDTVTAHLPDNPARPVLITDTPNGRDDTTTYRHVLMPVRASDKAT